MQSTIGTVTGFSAMTSSYANENSSCDAPSRASELWLSILIYNLPSLVPAKAKERKRPLYWDLPPSGTLKTESRDSADSGLIKNARHESVGRRSRFAGFLCFVFHVLLGCGSHIKINIVLASRVSASKEAPLSFRVGMGLENLRIRLQVLRNL